MPSWTERVDQFLFVEARKRAAEKAQKDRLAAIAQQKAEEEYRRQVAEENAYKLAQLQEKYQCAVTGEKASGPLVERVSKATYGGEAKLPMPHKSYQQASFEVSYRTNWEKPANLVQCPDCGQWVKPEFIHKGSCKLDWDKKLKNT